MSSKKLFAEQLALRLGFSSKHRINEKEANTDNIMLEHQWKWQKWFQPQKQQQQQQQPFSCLRLSRANSDSIHFIFDVIVLNAREECLAAQPL